MLSGPLVLLGELRELCRNRMTQATIFTALRSSNFHRTKSKSSRVVTSTVNTSCWSFQSAILSGLGLGRMSSGHLAGSESQGGPSHHSAAPTTLPPADQSFSASKQKRLICANCLPGLLVKEDSFPSKVAQFLTILLENELTVP